MNVIVEPEFLTMHASNGDLNLDANSAKRDTSPVVAKHLADDMIHKVASHHEKLSNNCIMLTNANEILTKDGIHGKIAPVGKGFGTGRHTANKRYRK